MNLTNKKSQLKAIVNVTYAIAFLSTTFDGMINLIGKCNKVLSKNIYK